METEKENKTCPNYLYTLAFFFSSSRLSKPPIVRHKSMYRQVCNTYFYCRHALPLLPLIVSLVSVCVPHRENAFASDDSSTQLFEQRFYVHARQNLDRKNSSADFGRYFLFSFLRKRYGKNDRYLCAAFYYPTGFFFKV